MTCSVSVSRSVLLGASLLLVTVATVWIVPLKLSVRSVSRSTASLCCSVSGLRVLRRVVSLLGSLLCRGDLFYVPGPWVSVGSSAVGPSIAGLLPLQEWGRAPMRSLLVAWTLVLNVCRLVSSA